MADEEFYKEITMEELKNMFKESKNIKCKNYVFSILFGNSVMGRLLDLFLDNQKTAIFIPDLVEKSDISRKSLYTNLLILKDYGIVTEIQVGMNKCYILNNRNSITKHLSKIWDIVLTDNAKGK